MLYLQFWKCQWIAPADRFFKFSVTACVSFPDIKNFENIDAFLKKLKNLEPRRRRNCLSTEQLRGLSIDWNIQHKLVLEAQI